MRKCPPGVVCVENVSMFFIAICLLLVVYLIYTNMNRNIQINNHPSEKIIVKNETRENSSSGLFSWFQPSWPYNNIPNDTYLNPYSAPLRDERYLVPQMNYIPPGTVPINVATSAVETSYRQVGILTPLNSSQKDSILPLMGRVLFNRRDLWNYYTISNQHNNVKLPISVKGRSALNDNGVDKLYNGDTVYVEGAGEAYKVTVYDNDTIKYLPFI
jgi:hypothetical protein